MHLLHEFGLTTPYTPPFFYYFLTQNWVWILLHGASLFPQKGIQTRHGLRPQQHVCSPNNSPLLQTAWFWLQAHKRKVQVWVGWVDWGVQKERRLEGAGNITVGIGQTVNLMSARQAGSVTQAELGLFFRGTQLQREELIPPLRSCPGADHQGDNTEVKKGERMASKTGIGMKIQNCRKETWIEIKTDCSLKYRSLSGYRSHDFLSSFWN